MADRVGNRLLDHPEDNVFLGNIQVNIIPFVEEMNLQVGDGFILTDNLNQSFLQSVIFQSSRAHLIERAADITDTISNNDRDIIKLLLSSVGVNINQDLDRINTS